jgi:hypothetical protein
LAPVIVWSPSHVTPATHMLVCVSHRSVAAQSESVAHAVAHDVPLHRYGEHVCVTAAGQLPIPSHVEGRVATPLVQLACTHVTDEPTKPAHDVLVLPSQTAAVHGFVAEPVGHAGRFVPWGLPATGVHAPTLPATSHASHWPVHASLQQTPSTQNPLTQAPFVPHASPGVSVPWHTPPVQNAPGAQPVVAVHAAGQLSDVPVHVYGEHVGLPVYPAGATPQVPSAGAPTACAQTSHEPEQGESQHTPSTQLPVEHSRHLPRRQSAPAAVLHVPPWAFCAWQVALAPQK